jgi:hypothetical protein
MTAEERKNLLNDLHDFRKSCVDAAWEIRAQSDAMNAMKKSAMTNEFVGSVLTQIVYEVEKLPRQAKPTLTMTRPLFELVFHDVFALFKNTPPKPLFMGKEVNVVEDVKMWWTLGNKYDVVIKEQTDDC